jgi:hypothetical protein
MTPLPPASAPRPIWGRVLVGCAILGGLVILAGMAAFIFGLYWLTSAGRHYPTAAVASPRTHGVIRVGDLAADPGARALLAGLFRRVQEAGQRDGQPQLPAWIRNMQAQQARQGISQWLPREATISLEPDAEDVPRIVLAANLRGFVQPMRLAITQTMKGDRKSTITRHGKHEVLSFGSDVSLCFMDGTLVVSYHTAAMAAALDRLAAASPSPRPADERGLPGHWDVSGWLDETTGTGALVGVLSPQDDALSGADAPLRALRGVRFGLDVESEDDARVLAEIAFTDAEAAAAARPWLAEGVTRWRERMEPTGLSATAVDSVEGARVRYELQLRGLEDAFARKIESQERTRRRRSDP